MPLVRLIDCFAVFVATPAKIDEAIKDRQAKLAQLSFSETVPKAYLAGLQQVRLRLLGEESDLARTEQRLTAELAKVQQSLTECERLAASTARDEAAASLLKETRNVAMARQSELQDAIRRLQAIQVTYRQILDAAEARVRDLLPIALRVARLHRQVLADGEQSEKALAGANALIERHLEVLRRPLVLMASVTGARPEFAVGADECEPLEAWFERVEAAAQQAVDQESTEAPRLS